MRVSGTETISMALMKAMEEDDGDGTKDRTRLFLDMFNENSFRTADGFGRKLVRRDASWVDTEKVALVRLKDWD